VGLSWSVVVLSRQKPQKKKQENKKQKNKKKKKVGLGI